MNASQRSAPRSPVHVARLHIAIAATALVVLAACGSTPKAVEPKPGGDDTKASSSGGFAPPGECVDPVVDGDAHDATKPFDKHVQLDVRDIDLDGDGVVDTFVKPAWSCGHGCNRSAYVVRSTCGHYVGTFPSEDSYEALDEKTNGLRDLKARPKLSDGATLRCYQLVLKYDGKEYKTSKHRECECKDDAPKCEPDWTDGADWQPQ
ncbi:MAG: hypothetical protein ABI175_07340 [Polyangiales bacterium]